LEVVDLFPRSILKGELPTPLLEELLALGTKVLKNPESNPDASLKLAGQLSQQRELRPNQPGVQPLIEDHLLPGCERWIRHVIDRQPPQGRGPWVQGRYHLKLIDLWLNCQIAGDYNPTHTHGGSFSGVIFLKTPPQITANRFDGQLCFHGPEEWHLQSFRTGTMNKLESMDPNSSLIEAREIAETIEHLSTQLKPDVIRAARKDKEGRLYLDRIEYALGTIGKALILTDYTIDEEKDIDKLEAFRESQQHMN
jgi:hypothetical protein